MRHHVFQRCIIASVLTLGSGCRAPAKDDPLLGVESFGIIGGRPATAAERFATVAIVDTDGVQECTGVLIAPRVVVTAAHCVVLQDSSTGEVTAGLGPKNLKVIAGALDVAEASVDQNFSLREVVRHPEFAGATSPTSQSGLEETHDVALLLLEKPVDALVPATIPPLERVDQILSQQKRFVIAGYGTRDSAGTQSGTLYIAETPYQVRDDREFIAGSSGEPDSCAGDSGGPAYSVVDDQVWLLGISVRALPSPDGWCGSGGVYTLLPAYAPWLEQNSDHEYASPEDDDPEREQSAGCDFVHFRSWPAERGGGGTLLIAVSLGARHVRLRRQRRSRWTANNTKRSR